MSACAEPCLLRVCARHQSEVVYFEYGVSSTPTGDADGLPDIAPYVYVGLAEQAAATQLSLEHGSVYYGAVRALVRANNAPQRSHHVQPMTYRSPPPPAEWSWSASLILLRRRHGGPDATRLCRP